MNTTAQDVPERFVPSAMAGELAAAEHLGRYRWAAAMAAGRTVLDAGCGMAYGAAMLAQAGAAAVTGVDVAGAVLDAVREEMPPGVELHQADVGDLPFADGAFELITCFEVIEHVPDPLAVLGELRRVLAPDGVLLISSPNRDRYVPGNPHHVREFSSAEFEALLTERFAHVRIRRQTAWLSAAVLDDEAAAAADLGAVADVTVLKVAACAPGEETYTVAMAGDGALPDDPRVLVLTDTAEPRRWLELYAAQHEVLERQRIHIDNMERHGREIERLRARLAQAEQELARVPTLELEIAGLQAQVAAMGQEATDRSADLARAHAALRQITASPSWRLTRPLRALKRALGR